MTVFHAGGVICEDDVAACRALDAILTRRGYTVLATVSSAEELLRAVAGLQAQVILIELALAGLAGLRILPALAAVAPGCAVVVLSPFVDLRPSAIEAGAYDLVDTRDLRDLDRCLDRLVAETAASVSSPGAGNGAA